LHFFSQQLTVPSDEVREDEEGMEDSIKDSNDDSSKDSSKDSNEDSREDSREDEAGEEVELDNILAEDAWRELGETPEVWLG
jgi:hypothetical protein